MIEDSVVNFVSSTMRYVVSVIQLFATPSAPVSCSFGVAELSITELGTCCARRFPKPEVAASTRARSICISEVQPKFTPDVSCFFPTLDAKQTKYDRKRRTRKYAVPYSFSVFATKIYETS